MPDFGSEVMAEALAQRALVKPVYTIPIIPLSNSNQYRHQDHIDMKDYKKVRLKKCFLGLTNKMSYIKEYLTLFSTEESGLNIIVYLSLYMS